jgi:hypothetical protein
LGKKVKPFDRAPEDRVASGQAAAGGEHVVAAKAGLRAPAGLPYAEESKRWSSCMMLTKTSFMGVCASPQCTPKMKKKHSNRSPV